VFLGTHTPRLDDKGRLILPAKFREQLAGGIVITKGQERCLYVFPIADFEARAAQRPAPVTRAERDHARTFFASASAETPDRTGRVPVPAHLREYAGLERDCMVIGANDHLEIWDAPTWAAHEASTDQAYSESGELPLLA